MLFTQLWSEYLEKTMPVAALVAMPLVFVQMLGGLLPLFSLYRSIRRDSAAEKVMLCATPGVFIVTFAIIEPLFFGSFLGEGFPWVRALRKFLYQPAFFAQSAALALVFLALALLSGALEKSAGRLWALFFWLGMGAELTAALVVLAVSGDYFLGRGNLFFALKGDALKWLVYGVYLLLYKVCVLLLCLLWRLLFSDRKLRDGAAVDPDHWLRQYFCRGYKAYGYSLLMFSALWGVAVVGGLYSEGSPYLWALAVELVLVGAGLGCLSGWLWRPNYRRILTWDTPERTVDRLYHEVVELPPLVKTDIGFLTEHYFVKTLPLGIYCRALLEPDEVETKPMGACVLHFQDGARCRLNSSYASLLGPLLGKRPNSR